MCPHGVRVGLLHWNCMRLRATQEEERVNRHFKPARFRGPAVGVRNGCVYQHAPSVGAGFGLATEKWGATRPGSVRPSAPPPDLLVRARPPPSPTPRAGRRLLPRQGARAPARPSSRSRALDTVPSTNKQSRVLWPDPVLAARTAGICFSFLAAGEGVKCLHDDSGSRSHRHQGQQGCSHKPPWVATHTSPAFSINLRPRAGHELPSER